MKNFTKKKQILLFFLLYILIQIGFIIYYKNISNKIENNWSLYVNQILDQSFQSIQQEFLEKETNSPISIYYLKNFNFIKKLIQKYDLQDIKIYDNIHDIGPTKKLLYSNNKTYLGTIELIPIPKETTLQNLQNRFFQHSLFAFSCLLLIVCFYIFLYIYKYHNVKNIFIFILALIFLRHIMFYCNFVEYILPFDIHANDIFISIHLPWSKTLYDILITTLLFATIAYIFHIMISIFPKNKKQRFYIFFAFLCTILLYYSYSYIVGIIHSIIQSINFYIFDSAIISPTYETITLYLAIFCCIMTLYFIFRKYYLFFHTQTQCPYMHHIFSIVIFYILSNLYQNSHIFPSIFIFHIALTTRFTKKTLLRHFILFAFITLSLFPILVHSSQQKMRAMIEDNSNKYTRYEDYIFIPLLDIAQYLEQSLEIKHAIENQQQDLAISIWTQSDFFTRFSNIDIQIYNTKQRISQFSLNMVNSFSYDFHVMSKINNIGENTILEQFQIENGTFFLGIIPIHSTLDKMIGKIAIIIRYPELAKTLPLPDFFSQKKDKNNTPLLLANFQDKILKTTNNPFLSKNHTLPELSSQMPETWKQEIINQVEYDNYYFQRTKQNSIGLIGYPRPTWINIIFYYLQFHFTIFLFLFIPLYIWKILQTKKFISYIPFEYKLFWCFLIISLLPLLFIITISKQKVMNYLWESYQKNIVQYLETAEKDLQEEVVLPQNEKKTEFSFFWDDDSESMELDDYYCKIWEENHQQMLNYYHISSIHEAPSLHSTSRRELFDTGIFSKTISDEIIIQLIQQKKDVHITLETIGNYKYIVGYKSIVSKVDNLEIVGIISIPMIFQQEELERSNAEIIATLLTIYTLLFILIILVSFAIAHQISRPLTHLLHAIHQVSEGNLHIDLPHTKQDEFRQIFDSFHQMTKDLDSSRKQLVEAEKNAAWKEMARQIAHEIKNPLHPLKFFIQYLEHSYTNQSPQFPQVFQKSIATILKSIEKITNTIKAFFDYAKFKNPELSPQPLLPILQQCQDELAYTFEHDNIQFDVQLPLENVKINTESKLLQQIFLNFLLNAQQSLDKTDKKISFYTNLTNTHIQVYIKDNGCGMSPEEQKKIFQPNYTTKSYGFGLGLAIAYEALQHMQANIQIESEEKKGTTFMISFPLV